MNKILLFFALIFIGSFILFGYMHEQVHVTIFDHYDIESEVKYLSSFPNFATVYYEPCPTEECTLAHNINEAIGYQLIPLYILMGFGLFLIIAILLFISFQLTKLGDY